MRPAHSPHEDRHEQWIIETLLWQGPTCDSWSDPREWSIALLALEIASTLLVRPLRRVPPANLRRAPRSHSSTGNSSGDPRTGGWPGHHICDLARNGSPESCHQLRVDCQNNSFKASYIACFDPPPYCLAGHVKQSLQNKFMSDLKVLMHI
ncbi:hypothetical protein IF2G_01387 [Cordyceps javanica]|nr:hypothetical protein IF2G_01387 [Cordyceps javanica]